MTRAMQYRMFWLSLSTMIDAGLPVLRSLNILIGQYSDNDKFQRGIKKIAEDIQAGCTFAEAMSASGMFSRAEVSAIRAGEVGGMLEVVTSRISSGQIPSRADQYYTFYQVLGSMITCGVPILQALKISMNGLDEPLKKAIQDISDSIKEGDTLAAPMDASQEFSSLDSNLVDIGEESGCLDAMLLRLAKLSQQIKF